MAYLIVRVEIDDVVCVDRGGIEAVGTDLEATLAPWARRTHSSTTAEVVEYNGPSDRHDLASPSGGRVR